MNTEQRNYCKELDELFAPIFQEIEKDLNKWSFGEATPEIEPGNIRSMPVVQSLGTCTKVSREVDAFNLESPCAGMVKRQHIELKDLGEVIVVRRIFGYYAATRALETKDNTIIKPMLKEMVLVLLKERGFSPEKLNLGVYGLFKRPGANEEYFRESDNFAGFEVRLYSSTTLAETL